LAPSGDPVFAVQAPAQWRDLGLKGDDLPGNGQDPFANFSDPCLGDGLDVDLGDPFNMFDW
jgi:hypothetical protein